MLICESGVPHCAFENTASLQDIVKPRESVEVRALVFDSDENLALESVASSRRHGPKAVYLQQDRGQEE